MREWLGAMVTGGIVDYEPNNATYSLPAENSAWLTREASPNNLAVTTQFVSMLGSVEDEIIACFRNGGGVPYSSYPRFHEVMAEESGQTVVAALVDIAIMSHGAIVPNHGKVVSPLNGGLRQAVLKAVLALKCHKTEQERGCGGGYTGSCETR